MLAALYNLPQTSQEWLQFSFANQADHVDIAQEVYRKTGQNIILSPLDPIPFHDIGAWAYNHQSIHDQQNGILGIAGQDLTSANLQSREELIVWIDIHAREHQLADVKLAEMK